MAVEIKSGIGLRLGQVADAFFGGNRSKLASSIGMTPGSFNKYLQEERTPGGEILTRLYHIGVNINWLLTGDGVINYANHKQSELNIPQVVTTDRAGRDNVVLVAAKAAAGYLMGYGDPEYYSNLPSFHLPMLNGGLYRMFEVSGESMWPNLTSGDYVVAEFVENWQEMPTRQVYVVICIEQGIIVKRVSNLIKDLGKVLCQSDNPDKENYKPIELLLPEIKEIWRVRYKISASMDLQNTYTSELGHAWSEIQHIKKVNLELEILKNRLTKIESGLNEVKEEKKKFSN